MVDVADKIALPQQGHDDDAVRTGSAIMRPVEIVASGLVVLIVGVLLMGVTNEELK